MCAVHRPILKSLEALRRSSDATSPEITAGSGGANSGVAEAVTSGVPAGRSAGAGAPTTAARTPAGSAAAAAAAADPLSRVPTTASGREVDRSTGAARIMGRTVGSAGGAAPAPTQQTRAAQSTAHVPTSTTPEVATRGGLKPQLGTLTSLYNVQCKAAYEAVAHMHRSEAGIRDAVKRYSQLKYADADTPLGAFTGPEPAGAESHAACTSPEQLFASALPPRLREASDSFRYITSNDFYSLNTSWYRYL